MRVQVHVARGRSRGLLPVVDEVRFAIGKPDEHEAAAAEVPRRRVGYGKRETGGHRGIHGISALLHDLDAGAAGIYLHARHHGVPGVLRVDHGFG